MKINFVKETVFFIGIQYGGEGQVFPLVNLNSTKSTVVYKEEKHIILNYEDYKNCLLEVKMNKEEMAKYAREVVSGWDEQGCLDFVNGYNVNRGNLIETERKLRRCPDNDVLQVVNNLYVASCRALLT